MSVSTSTEGKDAAAAVLILCSGYIHTRLDVLSSCTQGSKML